jgi:hypothetical protein
MRQRSTSSLAVDPREAHESNDRPAVEISRREGRHVPPPHRLTAVIAAAYQTYTQTVDAALRELLVEVVIAMGIDQDFRTEISREDALQVLEALRYIREARP